jgi:hypothetical protein
MVLVILTVLVRKCCWTRRWCYKKETSQNSLTYPWLGVHCVVLYKYHHTCIHSFVNTVLTSTFLLEMRVQSCTVQYCSRHGFTYIRGWMQMVLAPDDLFSWNNNTMRHNAYDRYLHYCWLMLDDTYSVHDRSLKPWWGRLPCLQTSRYVFSPPLSRLNWRSLSPTGGPGPPVPKMASPPLGSAHTPFPGSRTSTVTYLVTDMAK